MKKNNKDVMASWAFILIIFMLLFSMTACTAAATPTMDGTRVERSDTPEPTSTPAQKPPTATPTATPPAIQVNLDDLEGISIRLVHPWPGEAGEVLEDVARKFSLSNPWDIWVDVEAKGSENALLEQVESDLIEGDPPALIVAPPYALSMLENDFATVLLTDYFNHPEYGMDGETREDIPQVYLDQFTLDEQLIALPIAPHAKIIIYNQTWAEALGFDTYPVDEVSFSEQACAATAANLSDRDLENDYTGGFLMNYDPGVLASWYSAFGGEIVSDESPQFNTDAGRSAFGYLEELYSPDQNCIWVGRQQDPYLYFANRFALMYAGTTEQIPLQKAWMAQAGVDDQWMAIGFPGPDGEVMVVDSPGLFISESTPEKQLAAWLFAEHLLTPEIQARLVQSLFSLPVRESAIDYLGDFPAEYPQWTQSYEMIDVAHHLPISDDWGVGRWVLQDGIIRLFAQGEEQLTPILEELDQMILDLAGTAP
jgi:ABC-type glycerol-3-phosphate transport system substrate-binding protein